MPTPESKVKKRVRQTLEEMGVRYWEYMPVPQGFSRQNIPDFLICFAGLFLAIETKTIGNQPTTGQEIELLRIQEAGGLAIVIDETNVEQLPDIIHAHARTVQDSLSKL